MFLFTLAEGEQDFYFPLRRGIGFYSPLRREIYKKKGSVPPLWSI